VLIINLYKYFLLTEDALVARELLAMPINACYDPDYSSYEKKTSYTVNRGASVGVSGHMSVKDH
jgi:hypothetical protein